MKALYHYLRDHIVSDEFTRDLNVAVEIAREHKGWETEYMDNLAWEMDHVRELERAKVKYKAEGKIEGKIEGKKEGKKEGMDEMAAVIKELRNGKTKDRLLEEGYDPDTIEKAMEALGEKF